jgi:hypothetical protein
MCRPVVWIVSGLLLAACGGDHYAAGAAIAGVPGDRAGSPSYEYVPHPPPPPAADSRSGERKDCPVIDFGILLMLPSCCTSKGMCGVDVSSVGGPSCLDLASAAARARMAGASAVFPAPQACDEVDAGSAR